MNTIADIPLEQLRESPFNPRRTFADIDSLAADIAAHGRVLQPLLVRPIYSNPLQRTVGHYEVVFGHRRLRAAAVAGLATVPCMVQELDTVTPASAAQAGKKAGKGKAARGAMTLGEEIAEDMEAAGRGDELVDDVEGLEA